MANTLQESKWDKKSPVLIRKLQDQYEVAGQNMNITNCEYLSVGIDETCDLVLEDFKIKGVQSCT